MRIFKKSSLLFIFLCVFLVLTGCGEKKDVVTTITGSINGVVTDVSMNSITISNDNKSYSFSKYDYNEKNESSESIFNGDTISIEFTGTVYSDRVFQDSASIDKISIQKYADLEINPDYDTSGIFAEYYQMAYRKLLSMTLEERVGQVLFARVPAEKQIEAVMKYNLGGYIMFGRDFKDKSKSEVISNISSYQKNSFIPLIIAVDEEGGDVVRVSSNPNLASSRFKSPQAVYSSGGFDAIKNDTIEKSNVLSSLGINMNLAPVSDVSTNSKDYIYYRSFGHDASLTSTFVKTVIDASKQGDVTYTLKHFPGYGNNVDTHTGIAIDNRSLESFKTSDFLPFEAGIKEGALAILVSHNIVTSMDSKTPASLSKSVHDILRKDLNFRGIVMTDDLAMDAIKKYTTNSPSVDALNAGNDLVLISDYVQAFNDIKNAIDNGALHEDTLNQSVLRVLAYKYYVGLL